MNKKRNGTSSFVYLPVLLAAIFLLLWFFTGIYRLDREQTAQGRQQLETALRRAAVSCYSTQGVYPPSLEYLTTQYGITVDSTRYRVFYRVFAENLMPDITVLVREP